MSIPLDAEKLYNALFNALGDEREQGVLEVVLKYGNSARRALEKYYDAVYCEKSLMEDLKSQLTGHYRDVVTYLFMNPIDFDCIELNNALEKITYNQNNIFELITARPHWHLELVNQKYKEMYGKDLGEEVSKKFKGDVGRDLNIILNTTRNENKNPDHEDAAQCAKILYESEPKEWVKNESIFTDIFASKSPEELILIGRYYYKKTGITPNVQAEKSLSGKEQTLIKEVLYNVCRPAELYAQKIREAVTGLGTDTNCLNRILVTRNEIDMTMIRKFYKYYYKVNLQEDIIGDTSGTYKRILTELSSK